MANVTEDNTYLEALNDKNVILMIPVIVYIAVLTVLGSVGNILVCVYFGCKTSSSTNSIFIVSLAVFDLMVCMLTMPMEIVGLRFFYNFASDFACKSARVVNHFAANGSAVTLLIIAIDRYRRICRPLNRQLDIKHAKLAICVAVILSLLLSWPAAPLYSIVTRNITLTVNTTVVEVLICTTVKEETLRSYLWSFYVSEFVLFIASTTVLFSLYTFVGRAIYRFKKRRLLHTYAAAYRHDQDFKTHDTEIHIETIEYTLEKRNGETSQSNHEKGKRRPVSSSSVSFPESNDNHTKDKSPDNLTIKYTLQMLFIAVIYVLSYLPYIGLVIWKIFQNDEGVVEDDTERLWFNTGVRSYLLNSAVNPIVYGFLNEHFRRFLRQCCFCTLPNDK